MAEPESGTMAALCRFMPRQTSIETPGIDSKIYIVRAQTVMLDSDLAALYQVPTKRLKEQVRRNINRFPSDFMFQLNEIEWDFLRSQIATSKTGRGGNRILPVAFTEHGIAMLSSVLNSDRAVEVNASILGMLLIPLHPIALFVFQPAPPANRALPS
jgi:ORF6N domain